MKAQRLETKNNWKDIVISHINNIEYEIKENNSEETNIFLLKINSEDNDLKEQNINFSNIESDKAEKDIFRKDHIQIDNKKSLDSLNINNKKSIENKEDINKNTIRMLYKNSNLIIDKNIDVINSDSFIFNGKTFKKYYRDNKYKKEDKILRIIFKCINHRKDEKLRLQLKKPAFCNATIEYIYPKQNIRSGYFFKIDHSDECKNLFKINIDSDIYEKSHKLFTDKQKFIEDCEKIMNSSEIFDRNLYKDEFKKLYNSQKLNFGIDNNFISNIITKWKLKTNRFKKISVLDNPKDYNNRLILTEYRTIYTQEEKKKEPQKIEYIIWANEENLRRIRISNHYFIDSTFHHPVEYKQLLIIMYHDIVSNLKIFREYIH